MMNCGPPQPPWWYGGGYEYPRRPSPTIEEISEYEEQLDKLKQKLKDKEEKGKRKKPEPVRFSFMECFGFLTFFSIPITLGQIYLLQYISVQLANISH